MLNIKASARQIQSLKSKMVDSKSAGDFRVYIKTQALLLYFEFQNSIEKSGQAINKNAETVRLWVQEFAAYGLKSLKLTIRTGRQPKLTKAQCRELHRLISGLPSEQGFIGACWNSAMIQALIQKLYNVEYSVKYIPELMR
ncbi:MAG: helix-turn-helix domain-containing protein [Deltaproteobacteria bacterium]|nr:helix-turn-helix domain-containing protein [Deltaproteobacteria bacterium]